MPNNAFAKETHPPALPLPKRIPRNGDEPVSILRVKKHADAAHLLSDSNVMENPVAKPTKPIPRPRTKLMTQSVINPDSPDSGSLESRSRTSTVSTPSASLHSIDSVEETRDGYLQFTEVPQTIMRSQDNGCRLPRENPSLSDQDLDGSDMTSPLRSPLARSASDGAYVERSSNLIKWESIGSLGELDFGDCASAADVWSINEDTHPPTYTPPPRPESCITIPEGELIPIEKPPPLPPRPAKSRSKSEIDRPPMMVTHKDSTKNGITTICSGNLVIKHVIKDMGKRWCVLKDGKFSMFSDKKEANLRTTISCSDIVLVDSSSDRKDKFGFDILVLGGMKKPVTFLAESLSDLSQWIKTLAKSICDSSNMYETALKAGLSNYDYGGKLYIRSGATGQWLKSWAEVKSRHLTLYTEDAQEECDLRKVTALHAVNVEFYASKTEVVCSHAAESGKPFVLNLPGRAIYIQADTEKLTQHWMKIMHKKAKDCGQAIEDQPLTSEDVPVVLDRCMQFVSAHGLKTEGIYRHSGVSSRIAAVLDYFSKDPHSCHLSRDQFSEHDVAGALKRFLRNLPEPLIGLELHQPLLHSSEVREESVKILKYKSLLSQLPVSPNYATLKKLLGHLKVVSESSAYNLMTSQNIAASFGSTLMSGIMASKLTDSVVENNYDSAQKEINVMMDFLNFYEVLFDVNEADLEKERKIQIALETISKQMKSPSRAGDFLMEIFWEDRKSEAVNVPVSTKLTAGDLCRSLREREKIPADPSCSLHEVIFDEKLSRPVHFTEEIIPIIMRWTAWNESNICSYSSNYLCIKRNTLYEKIEPLIADASPIAQQIRFAREKSFKKTAMEFSRMKLVVFKSGSAEKELDSWMVENLLWFEGCSPQRFCFTFIERDDAVEKAKQHKTAFGHTVACETENDLHKWLATLIQAQVGRQLYSNPSIPRKGV